MKVTIHSVGMGPCALTGKESDGVTVSFEDEKPYMLSWKAFRQIVSMKVGHKQEAKPAMPNGPALAIPK